MPGQSVRGKGRTPTRPPKRSRASSLPIRAGVVYAIRARTRAQIESPDRSSAATQNARRAGGRRTRIGRSGACRLPSWTLPNRCIYTEGSGTERRAVTALRDSPVSWLAASRGVPESRSRRPRRTVEERQAGAARSASLVASSIASGHRELGRTRGRVAPPVVRSARTRRRGGPDGDGLEHPEPVPVGHGDGPATQQRYEPAWPLAARGRATRLSGSRRRPA
jgi:hypothetical protein